MKTCPCGSGHPYESCCLPLHKGEVWAKSPQQLMRSRYCAFALGQLGQYLIETWDSEYRQGLSASDLQEVTQHWIRLDVLGFSTSGSTGQVAFKAWFLEGKSLHSLHEVSRFKHTDRWRYTDGDIIPTQPQPMTQNQSCPCQSGKKFKRCCGA